MATLQRLLACVLALSGAPLLAEVPADVQKGRAAFVRCMACHSIKANEPHRLGPNLKQAIGKRAASVKGFTYSEALRKANLTWDDDTLRRWIKNPNAVAPGSSMAYANTLSAAEIEALIAYLKTEASKP